MKKILISTIAALAAFGYTFAAEQTIEIHTSAECQECKVAIEEAVNDLSGIESCNLVIDSQMLTVTFEDEDIEKETIKRAINMAGYDADETKATKRGLSKLPDCCKPGGMEGK